MRQKIDISVVLISMLVVVSSCLYAQEQNNKVSLAQVIKTLQNKHTIQFNYAEDVIEDIQLIAPSKELSLKGALMYLEKHTKLSFTVSNSQFVVVQFKNHLKICGYLKDENSQEPLSSATIQTEKNSTTSDDNGFFQLPISSDNTVITIRHLGYKTIKESYRKLNNNNCEDVFLQEDTQPLSEILISNYIINGIDKISDGTFEMDFSKFDILPGVTDTDVLQSIQSFPGIQSSNETVSNINIRGGTHDQNLILWDGIKMYQSGHFFGLISMYNPHITQKVALHKNGSDVIYTDGVSGTIAMQTDHRLNTSFKGAIGVNLIDANGFSDIPIGKKSSLQIAGRKALSNLVETPIYSTFFDRISQDTEVESNVANVVNSDESFDFHDVSLRWIYKMNERDELQLNFINVSNKLEFNENTTINDIDDSRESSIRQNSIAGALRYNRIWNEKFQTAFEVYETDYKLRAINANVLDSQRFLQENKVSETSLKLKTNYHFNNRMSLLNGYHFVETEITNLDDVDTPLFRLLVSEVVRTHAVFSQFKYLSVNKKTTFKTGIRLNYIDKFEKTIFEPRFSFSHCFLNDFSIEALAEFKHQNTSQVINFQNDFLGIEKRRWQLSNDMDIPVVTSKQISLGVNYNKKGWLLSVESYYKKVKDITTQSQGFQNQYEFVKTKGDYDAKGLDVLLRKKVNKLNAWLSYSYLNSQYTFKSLEATSFPSNYNINHTITFGTAYVTKALKVSAGFNWNSGKPTTNTVLGNEIVDGEINYAKTNDDNLNEYLRLDMSALYHFKLGKNKALAGLSIWNLLDRENEINNYYRINGESVTETIQGSLGFTPNVVFRVYFNQSPTP